MCRLQTFPDGLSIACGRTEMQRQLGNAVPSLLAEILAREIRAQLLDRPLKAPLKLLPPRSEKVPPRERLAPLPAKYRKFIGKHEAHPGEGTLSIGTYKPPGLVPYAISRAAGDRVPRHPETSGDLSDRLARRQHEAAALSWPMSSARLPARTSAHD
jgi:hypothetical protein